MTLNRYFTRSLTVMAGIAAAIDTAFGVTIFAFGGLTGNGYDRVLFITFVLGFPAYLADVFRRTSVCFYMASLFLLRWALECFLGPGFRLDNPISWPMGIFLFLALALLQVAKRLATK
jgi:hypothetical protein